MYASYTAACTNRRLAHTQVWPVLRYLLAMAPSTAASRSASSNTMNGALPPSSIETRFMSSAHCAISRLPTAVEPVKLSLRTLGLAVISPPIAAASWPVTMFSTPGGRPARSASTPSASAEYGVCVAGLQTTVQRSEEHTSELQSLMRISYAVFCLKNKSNSYLIMSIIVVIRSIDQKMPCTTTPQKKLASPGMTSSKHLQFTLLRMHDIVTAQMLNHVHNST